MRGHGSQLIKFLINMVTKMYAQRRTQIYALLHFTYAIRQKQFHIAPFKEDKNSRANLTEKIQVEIGR